METKFADLTEQQKEGVELAKKLLNEFIEFNELQQTYAVKLTAKNLGVEKARKFLGRLCDFDKLLNAKIDFGVIAVVPVPEPASSEFPTAPSAEPAKFAIGPFHVKGNKE